LLNAVSNSLKYGNQGGAIHICVKLIEGGLHLIVCNEPGEEHAELLAMGHLEFRQGNTLHKNSSYKGISSGDGGWIMLKCAAAMAGNVSLTFSSDSTTLRLICPTKIYATDQLISNFQLPASTIVFFVDDAKIQRRLFPSQLATALNISKDSIAVRGADEAEIRSWSGELCALMQEHPESRSLVICDENLDYDTEGRSGSVSGSALMAELREALKEKNLERNLLGLIRSGNDNKQDNATYLRRAHGVLSKSVAKPQDVLGEVARVWCGRFGLPVNLRKQDELSCCWIQNEDYQSLVSEADSIVAMLDVFVSEESWSALWTRLHQVKGTCQLLIGMGVSPTVAEYLQEISGTVSNLRGPYKPQYLVHELPAIKRTFTLLKEELAVCEPGTAPI